MSGPVYSLVYYIPVESWRAWRYCRNALGVAVVFALLLVGCWCCLWSLRLAVVEKMRTLRLPVLLHPYLQMQLLQHLQGCRNSTTNGSRMLQQVVLSRAALSAPATVQLVQQATLAGLQQQRSQPQLAAGSTCRCRTSAGSVLRLQLLPAAIITAGRNDAAASGATALDFGAAAWCS